MKTKNQEFLTWISPHYSIEILTDTNKKGRENRKKLEKKIDTSGNGTIYALYKRKKLHYVGLTIRKLQEINTHTKEGKSHYGKWDSFRLFRINDAKLLDYLETTIIHIAQPEGNKNKKDESKFGVVLDNNNFKL